MTTNVAMQRIFLTGLLVGLITHIGKSFLPAFCYFTGDLKVTLGIFSGRPDPEWQVLTSDPNYKEIERLLTIARASGLIYRHNDMPPRLGYKGFLVLNTAKEKSQPELVIGPQTVELQQLLLKTIPDGVLPKELCKKISEQIDTGAVKANVADGT